MTTPSPAASRTCCPTCRPGRLGSLGANAVKILLYYTPFEDPKINDAKHAFIERIGDECAANDLPFFLEFVGYDPDGGNEKGPRVRQAQA